MATLPQIPDWVKFEHNVAQILTDQELQDIRSILTRKDTIVSVADQVDSETLPLQIEKLRIQRTNLINERNGLMAAEDAKNDGNKQDIFDNYETQIDAVESQIRAKEQELKDLATN